MPFFAIGSDGDLPAPPIQLRVSPTSSARFQLVEGFSYRSRSGDVYDVPPHPTDYAETTDPASVPPFLWGLLASYGRQLRAALMHDHLCDRANTLAAAGQRAEAERVRRLGDNLFREAMRDKQEPDRRVPWLRSWVFWAGVTMGRYAQFARGRLAAVVAHVGLAVVALLLAVVSGIIDLAAGGGWSPLTTASAAAYVGLLALAAAWWGDAPIVAIGIIFGPVLIPAVVCTLLAQIVVNVPDKILHLFDRSQPKAPVTPTGRVI